MRHAGLNGRESVFNLRGQQVAVLKADGVGFALEMNIDPASTFERVSALEAGILRGSPLAGGRKGDLCFIYRGFRAVRRRATAGPHEPNADDEDQDGEYFANGIGHDGRLLGVARVCLSLSRIAASDNLLAAQCKTSAFSDTFRKC